MTLKTPIKDQKERDSRKKSETYFAGNKDPLSGLYSRAKENLFNSENLDRRIVPNIKEKLEDYCEIINIKENNNKFRCKKLGDPIPDEFYRGRIETTDGGEIDISIQEKYKQPGAELHYIEANLYYDPEVDDTDVNFVRQVIKEEGLEKVINE